MKVHAVLAIAIACSVTLAAQVSFRLKGTVASSDGTPLTTPIVRTEAILGVRAQQFVGQKEFRVEPDAKGEWTILGLTPGLWVFEAHAKGKLPQAYALPIHMVARMPQFGSSNISYKFPFTLQPVVGDLSMIAKAAEAAESGQGRVALQSIAEEMEFAANADVLTAAGEVALVVRQAQAASLAFKRAIAIAPKHWRANLGLASAAMMLADWDTAAKAYWTARENAPGPYKQALSAAVAEMQQIINTRPGP